MDQKISFRQRMCVASRLRKEGYSIIRHRYSCRYGKMDLVAERENLICFVKILPIDPPCKCSIDDYFNEKEKDALKQTSAFFMSANESVLPYRIDLAMPYANHSGLSRVHIDYREDFLRGE